MKTRLVVLFSFLISLTSFYSYSQVGEKNKDIIHVNELDRSKILVRGKDGSIRPMDSSQNLRVEKSNPQNLEGQLDNTLDEFNQLDPANKPLAKQDTSATSNEDEDELIDRPTYSNDTKKNLAQLQEMAASQNVAAKGVPSFFSNMLGGLKSTMVKGLLQDNPMSKMSHQGLKSFLQQRIKDTKYEKVFSKFPKLLDILVELIRDNDALPSLMSMLDEQEKMLTYSYIVIGVIIFSIILNIFMFANAGIFKRILFKIFMTVSVPLLNLIIFYLMFKKHLDPTISIIKKYL